MSFNWNEIRAEFPALTQKVYGQNLVYLDSAATTLKPQCVIDRINQFYSYEAANVHRGAHFLSDRATELYENAREKVAQFINSNQKEIIFVKGATEGINFLAHGLGKSLNPDDEIILTDLEHHANIVPWQILAEGKNLKIKVMQCQSDGSLTPESLLKVLTPDSKILSLTHASNHLGNIVDLKPIIKLAHDNNLKVIVDGAQAIGKLSVDMQSLDCDFYVFSGHKMFSPFGIGVVFGKESLLKELPPYQGGGSMISQVSFEKTTFNDIPYRFEAGTPNIGGAIGLAAAIDFINNIGINLISDFESQLNSMFFDKIRSLNFIDLLGPQTPESKIPVFSFNVQNQHHSDVAFFLNQQSIAVRAGHHCTQPLLKKLNLNGSIRASLTIYNSETDIDQLIKGLTKAKELLQ